MAICCFSRLDSSVPRLARLAPAVLLAGSLACFSVPQLFAQQAVFSAEIKSKLELAVKDALAKTGVPGAQVGIVQNGQVVYTGAFGSARLSPAAPVTPEMVFRVGSVSKQFTAAAAMVLVEQGKLRLDDPVSTWFPELGHASEITLRNLLNQVSGYSDDYTEDYLTPEMAAPIDTYTLIKEWTAKPLDFKPGTRWQYSNTNYGLAALIVQKVAGEPFFQFLREQVLLPAGLTHVIDLDGPDVPALPVGYVQYGFGPFREAIKEGKGTMLGAGELAMPIGDLARWNTVVMKRQVLKPESWQTMQAEVALPNGHGSGYGMGFFLGVRDGRRIIDHSGEVNGFVSLDTLYPADGVAIAVLTNAESSTSALQQGIEKAVFAPAAKTQVPPNPAAESLLKGALDGLEAGRLDRNVLAENLKFFFTAQVIADYKASLAGLGRIKSLTATNEEDRGGMQGYFYEVKGSGKSVGAFIYVTADGKLDQLILEKLD